MTVSAELQAVLHEAVYALQLEDSKDWSAAVDSYYKAKSKLGFVVDMMLDVSKQQELADVCRGLMETYEYRIQESGL